MSDIVERLRANTFRAEDILAAADKIERLTVALQDMIEISKRNSEAGLMLIAIRRCAEHVLEDKA